MSRGPFATPDRTRGGLLAPFLVALLALGACALIGFEHVRPALDEGPETTRDAGLLIAMAVGSLATLVLVVRLARPGTSNPQDITTPPPPATATTTPPRSTATSAHPEPLADVVIRRARTIRRVFFVISAGMTLLVAATIALTAFSSREAIRSIDVPRILAPERSCPEPAAGADALDDRRTDCAPFPDDVFETGPTSIQGVDYDGVERDDTADCAAVLELAHLDSCVRLVRGSYLRTDGAARGFVAIIEFDTRDEARRVVRTINPEGLVFEPLADLDIWSRTGKARSCSTRIGRYVTCVLAAPIGTAPAADALETAQHLLLLATDTLVARRFATA